MNRLVSYAVSIEQPKKRVKSRDSAQGVMFAIIKNNIKDRNLMNSTTYLYDQKNFHDYQKIS